MVDPILDLIGDQGSALPKADRLSFVRSVLRMRPWHRGATISQAPQAPRDTQGLQDGPQRTGTRFSNLINAALASLQGRSSVLSSAKPPPDRDDKPPSDTSAWLFNANMDSLALNFLGVAILDPRPGTALNSALDAGERAADRLPLSTPVRPPRGSGGRPDSSTERSGAAGPSPFSTLLSSATRTNVTSMDSQSNAYLSGNESSSASSVDDAPDIFLTVQDPRALDGNGVSVGILRGIVIPLSGGLSPRDLIPIPDFAPGTAMPPPPQGYLYGRAAPSPPLDGQIVPAGTFTIRIDRADPAQGGAPNIFYRELNIGGGSIDKARDNNAADNDPGGRGPRVPPQEERGSWVPKVRAIRIPPYGLFERPPPRPRGYHYGRRLYLSSAELLALEDRGIRAPPGRKIIRLVHVRPPEGDSYERPTIFYQIEPRARAPRAPSEDDPGPNILYCTLPTI